MRIALHSDLHENENPSHQGLLQTYSSLPRADVVILGGDCHKASALMPFAEKVRQAQQAKAVIVIAGNHEFHGGKYHDVLKELRAMAEAFENVYFLERESIVIDEVMFLGTTLWTDFALYGPDVMADCIRTSETTWSDFTKIGFGDSLLTARDIIAIFNESKAWLRSALASASVSRQIVVTHHGVSRQCVAPKYRGTSIAPAYASDLEDLVAVSSAAYWCYGHTHWSQQVRCAGKLLISNARGYENQWHRTGYNPNFLIEI